MNAYGTATSKGQRLLTAINSNRRWSAGIDIDAQIGPRQRKRIAAERIASIVFSVQEHPRHHIFSRGCVDCVLKRILTKDPLNAVPAATNARQQEATVRRVGRVARAKAQAPRIVAEQIYIEVLDVAVAGVASRNPDALAKTDATVLVEIINGLIHPLDACTVGRSVIYRPIVLSVR